jgi:ABC-type bacteriocin/lantibiotic exporter with double-glycine peptidase domain
MQDIKLPPGTIGDVVRGSMNVADEEVWHALELASFAEDVKAMPMQLNTIITSGGASLSGGQRQRLCISRALLKKPKLLFLDEATSALDNKTQQQVTDVFDSLGVTRIIIAHRLSTIRNTDQIFVLREGRIQESGTWDELSVSPSSYLYKDKTVDQG